MFCGKAAACGEPPIGCWKPGCGWLKGGKTAKGCCCCSSGLISALGGEARTPFACGSESLAACGP